MTDPISPTEFERIVENSDMSRDEKDKLIELKWTVEEFGPIRSQAQYDAFGRARAAIESTQQYNDGLLRPAEWFGTQQGIMWAVLTAARSDWEEANR